MTIVVDASVAAKWLFQEEDTDRARALLGDAQTGRLSMIAPDLLPVEIASSLWKRVERERLSVEEVKSHYRRVIRLSPALVRISPLTETAFRLALAHKHPIYDCLYVALALGTPCPMVTADEKFFRSFSPAFPQIRLLREWE